MIIGANLHWFLSSVDYFDFFLDYVIVAEDDWTFVSSNLTERMDDTALSKLNISSDMSILANDALVFGLLLGHYK